MTVCRKCNGKGKVLDYVAERNCHGEWEKVLREIPCDKCQRKPMTNEEWFCQLSTKEKAKWMAKHMSFCEVCEIQTCRGDGCQRFDRGSMTETDAFREWLREKHK